VNLNWVRCDSLASGILVGHHLCAGSASAFNCGPYPFAYMYSVYFGGCIEASNIPLTCMDLLRNIDPEKHLSGGKDGAAAQVYYKVNLMTRTAFAVMFVWLRLVWWYPVWLCIEWDWHRYLCVALGLDWDRFVPQSFIKGDEWGTTDGKGLLGFSYASDLKAVEYGPQRGVNHMTFVIVLNIVVVHLLTILQSYWGTLVLGGIWKVWIAPMFGGEVYADGNAGDDAGYGGPEDSEGSSDASPKASSKAKSGRAKKID